MFKTGGIYPQVAVNMVRPTKVSYVLYSIISFDINIGLSTYYTGTL